MADSKKSKNSKKSYNTSSTGSRQTSAHNTLSKKSQNPTLRSGKTIANKYDLITDVNDYKKVLDAATKAAYDVKTKEASRALAQSENVSANNTANAVASLRNALIGSGSSGSNVGAANATALQALLGASQQNQATTLEGLQGLYGIADERAVKTQENAASALTSAESARENAANIAAELYGYDKTTQAQALLGLADLTGVESSNYYSRANTKTTADAQKYSARKGQKQYIKYSGGYSVR